MSSAVAQPTPAIKYLISHLPAIFVMAMCKPIRSPKSTVVFRNSFKFFLQKDQDAFIMKVR